MAIRLTEHGIAESDADGLGLEVVVQSSLTKLTTNTLRVRVSRYSDVESTDTLTEALKPPKGSCQCRVLYVLTQTVPALRALETSMAVLRLDVWTAAARPYVVLLPTRMASALSLNLAIEHTGPKISSCMMDMSSLTSAKIVGSMKYPSLPLRLPPVTTVAPSSWPALMYLFRC